MVQNFFSFQARQGSAQAEKYDDIIKLFSNIFHAKKKFLDKATFLIIAETYIEEIKEKIIEFV